MENVPIKLVTASLIAAAIYVFVKGRNAANIPGQVVNSQTAIINCHAKPLCNLKPVAMETSNCAIMLAACYLPCKPAYIPSTSILGRRTAFLPPLIPQTTNARILPNTSLAHGAAQCFQPPSTVSPNIIPAKVAAMKITTTCAKSKWVNPVAGCSKFGTPIKPCAIKHVTGMTAWCCAAIGAHDQGGCGPNLRCLESAGLCASDLNALNTWCV